MESSGILTLNRLRVSGGEVMRICCDKRLFVHLPEEEEEENIHSIYLCVHNNRICIYIEKLSWEHFWASPLMSIERAWPPQYFLMLQNFFERK